VKCRLKSESVNFFDKYFVAAIAAVAAHKINSQKDNGINHSAELVLRVIS
jgi:hypothetical protein